MRAKLILLIVLGGILWGLKTPIGAMWLYVWITLFRPQDFTFLPLPNLVPIAFAILTPQLGADCVCNSVGFADAGIGAGKSQIQMEQGIISSDVGIGGVPDIICRILDFGYGVG